MKKTLILLSAVILTFAACKNTGKIGETKLETRMDSISYALGRDLGKSLKQQEISISPEALYAALEATLNNESLTLTKEDQQQLIAELQAQLQKKQIEEQMKQMQGQQGQPQGQTQTPPGVKVQIGQVAPDFKLPTPEGKDLALSSLRGKVILVDFWAAWCRPCRMENPNVVNVYNKYKNNGFDVLGVSLDRTKDAWVQAIKDDGLAWNHVSDLKFWQSAPAQTYGVSAIPFSVLLDKQGKIIGMNLRGPALEQAVASALGM